MLKGLLWISGNSCWNNNTGSSDNHSWWRLCERISPSAIHPHSHASCFITHLSCNFQSLSEQKCWSMCGQIGSSVNIVLHVIPKQTMKSINHSLHFYTSLIFMIIIGNWVWHKPHHFLAVRAVKLKDFQVRFGAFVASLICKWLLEKLLSPWLSDHSVSTVFNKKRDFSK